MKIKAFILLTILGLTVTIQAQVEISSTGTGSPYILDVPAIFPLRSGVQVTFKANVINPSPATINVTSTGIKTIKKEGGTVDLVSGDIKAGQVVNLVYDGTNWQMLSPSGNSPTSGSVAGSGTQNFVTKWNNPAGTTIGNSSIFDNGSTVGIFDATPAGELHIFKNSGPRIVLDGDGGNVNGSTMLDFTTSGNSSATSFVGSSTGWQFRTFTGTYSTVARQNDFQLRYYDGSAFNNVLYFDYTGNVGLNTLNPSSKLHVKGSQDNNQLIVQGFTTQTTPLVLLQNSAGTELMRIHSDDPSNLFIGQEAGSGNNAVGGGINNTFLGQSVGWLNTTGTNNTVIGQNSLFSNTTGSSNTVIGVQSLGGNTTGSSNIAIGVQALQANSTGSNNDAVGTFALYGNTKGSFNEAMGFEALNGNTTGSYNIAIGRDALQSQTFANGGIVWNSENIAIGAFALNANQPTNTSNGSFNTALGTAALTSNTNGYNNTATGWHSLYSNTTGIQNTANGLSSLYYSQTGNNNTVMGYSAGLGVSGSSYSNNSIFGASAGSILTTGSNNTLLGFNAGNLITTGSNNIVLGNNISAASATGNNQLSIGNMIYGINLSGTGTSVSNGSIGIGLNNPQAKLHAAGPIQTGIPLGGLGGAAASTGAIVFNSAATAQTVTIQSGNTTVTYSMILPATQGAANTFLQNNGSGNLTWATIAGTLNGGTTNYLPKWSSATSLSSTSLVYDNGTNVGIGLNAPASTLHSSGQIRTGIPSAGLGGATATTGSLLFYNSGNGNTVNIQSGVTTLTYSLTLPTAAPAVSNSALIGSTAGTLSWAAPGATGAGLPAGTSGQTLRHDGTNWIANSFLFNNGSNVGIGTATPAARLHVFSGPTGTGLVAIEGSSTANGSELEFISLGNGATALNNTGMKGYRLWTYGDAYSTANLQNDYRFSYVNGTGHTPIFNIDNSGKVGVGLSTLSVDPINTLDVGGGAVVGNSWAATYTAPSSGMLVEGNVGIGATAPANKLVVDVANNDVMKIVRDNTSVVTHTAYLLFANRYGSGENVLARIGITDGGTNKGDLLFETKTNTSFPNSVTTEKMRILGNGYVGIGTSTPVELLNLSSIDSDIDQETYSTTESSSVHLNRARGTVTAPASVVSGDYFGGIGFKGYNGSFLEGAVIEGVVDGTPSATSMPGRLEFMTTPIGSTTSLTRMTVKNNGFVGIGTSPSYPFHVLTSTTGYLAYFDCNSPTGGTALRASTDLNPATGTGDRYGVYANAWYGQSSNYGLYGYGYGGVTSYGVYGTSGGATTNWSGYFSGNAEVTGQMGIGMTNTVPTFGLDVKFNGGTYISEFENTSTGVGADGIKITVGNALPDATAFYIGCYANAGSNLDGGIRGDAAGGVTFSSLSDGRLKQNIIDFTNALSLIDKIQPREYEFIKNPGKRQIGFIAQELQKIYPSAVSGSPEDDVKTSPMMIDYSKLTPLLTGGIKELHEIVKTQDQKIKTLEQQIEELKRAVEQLQKK
jgi:hypothetical protein